VLGDDIEGPIAELLGQSLSRRDIPGDTLVLEVVCRDVEAVAGRVRLWAKQNSTTVLSLTDEEPATTAGAEGVGGQATAAIEPDADDGAGVSSEAIAPVAATQELVLLMPDDMLPQLVVDLTLAEGEEDEDWASRIEELSIESLGETRPSGVSGAERESVEAGVPTAGRDAMPSMLIVRIVAAEAAEPAGQETGDAEVDEAD